MADEMLPESVDTVIVGNGPAALILSYILHGHIPYYDPSSPHFDSLLHKKLAEHTCLLDIDVKRVTDHFPASRFSYSTQVLPANVLIDTLVHPHGDAGLVDAKTCVTWHYQPEKTIPHVVLGNAPTPGGQWIRNLDDMGDDVQTLSYAEMLSLPGYSFAEHHQVREGTFLAPFTRPTRRQLADYFATYPSTVGIDSAFYQSSEVDNVYKCQSGFFIGSHKMTCKHLVLASGVYAHFIPPPPLLRPLLTLSRSLQGRGVLLVIGSGFTAADVIISTPPGRRIIHMYKWDPDVRPSPLRACHRQSYPEYAMIYRLMKRSAVKYYFSETGKSPGKGRALKSTLEREFLQRRHYEGLPNATITSVSIQDDSTYVVAIETNDGNRFEANVDKFHYAVGRRGSLAYLSDALLKDVLSPYPLKSNYKDCISSQTLRSKSCDSFEVAPDVFIVGSLVGDTLVRHAYGSCISTAGKLISRQGESKPFQAQ